MNLTLDHFKEHILGLVISEESAKAFERIPKQVKNILTKTYNSTMKSSVKSSKKTNQKKGDASLKKFDPDIQSQASETGEISEDERESEPEV